MRPAWVLWGLSRSLTASILLLWLLKASRNLHSFTFNRFSDRYQHQTYPSSPLEGSLPSPPTMHQWCAPGISLKFRWPNNFGTADHTPRWCYIYRPHNHNSWIIPFGYIKREAKVASGTLHELQVQRRGAASWSLSYFRPCLFAYSYWEIITIPYICRMLYTLSDTSMCSLSHSVMSNCFATPWTLVC